MATSKLQKALERGLQPGRMLGKELSKLRDEAVQTVEDARAVCEAPERVRPSFGLLSVDSELCALIALFQRVGGEEAFVVLRAEGLPRLIEIFDEAIGRVPVGEPADELLFLLKILAMARPEEGVERIVHAARRSLDPEGLFWPIIVNVFSEEHSHRTRLRDQLRDPLPEGSIAMAYLDFANRLARKGDLGIHPFDSPPGKTRLESWLIDPDSEHFSSARTAAASLPFLSKPEHDQLVALAMDHPLAEVQMEPAWAAARLGSASGLKLLGRFYLDVNHSATARTYLEELGREGAIPEAAPDPNFQVMAAMAAWLAHPMEFGRPPESITLLQYARVVLASHERPPLPLARSVPLQVDEPGAPDDVGIGTVDSITFALSGKTIADQPPKDICALHCCWELAMNKDPRASRSAAWK